MASESKILSLREKLQLLARDIYDTAIISNSLKLEHFVPSKQIRNLLDKDEVDRLIEHLSKRGILTHSYPALPSASWDSPKGGFQAYDLAISQPKIRHLLGLEDIAYKTEKGIKLHPKFTHLVINGDEIPLGKGTLHKSLQYWICLVCLKKPNTPVKETIIMAKYATDYDITARGRAVRDAVYKLNPKIKNKTGIDELFTYSSGYVTFNADKLK